MRFLISSCCGNSICHSRETCPEQSRRSGNPAFSLWTPAPRFRGDKFTPASSRGRGDIIGFCFPQQILINLSHETQASSNPVPARRGRVEYRASSIENLGALRRPLRGSIRFLFTLFYFCPLLTNFHSLYTAFLLLKCL